MTMGLDLRPLRDRVPSAEVERVRSEAAQGLHGTGPANAAGAGGRSVTATVGTIAVVAGVPGVIVGVVVALTEPGLVLPAVVGTVLLVALLGTAVSAGPLRRARRWERHARMELFASRNALTFRMAAEPTEVPGAVATARAATGVHRDVVSGDAGGRRVAMGTRVHRVAQVTSQEHGTRTDHRPRYLTWAALRCEPALGEAELGGVRRDLVRAAGDGVEVLGDADWIVVGHESRWNTARRLPELLTLLEGVAPATAREPDTRDVP
ncbi:hypothetical protein [Litorihabitans aurantiacus]|uniref:Uncharacterized protein n=1 Tax=Litorihabitans aurantiacus TaxID=1930061 RepID=A0AA38CW52_9MICO|nr:hypothetical protein [Litorihabitans aurantiacus]GMA33250.1 hypothetical protein GCM10025875_32420 [Litorihabitans aurantiacus]